MIAWLPVASLAALWALMYLRQRVKRHLRRRSTPPQPETLLEMRVAVGSLAGVAPADIQAHVVITLDGDGGLKVSGAGCKSLLLMMLATASAAAAGEAHRAHDCAHGDER